VATLRDLQQRREFTPAAVVEEASSPDHPLHDRFEWNDSIAGAKFRLSQAAAMIRSVRLVYKETPDGEDVSVRAFHALPGNPGVYKPVDEVMADPFSRALLLREMERDMKAMIRRFGHMSEFADILKQAQTQVAS
jgi:hypothetical protein